MDLSTYSSRQIHESSEWEEFVAHSQQGTLFNQLDFLNALDGTPILLGCYKGNELKGAICFFEQDSKTAYRPELVIYNSMMLKSPDKHQSVANQFAEQFRTISAMTRDLTTQYQSISFQTHASLTDIRPLLWHNYGTEQKKFQCTPRYTTTILLNSPQLNPSDALDIESISDSIYQGCSKTRRQEIRYARSKGVTVTRGIDLPLFSQLYRETFTRQGKETDETTLSEICRVCQALSDNQKLVMYVARDVHGSVGSIAIFGFDNKRAYYLYGANSLVARQSHTGSYVLFHAFEDLAKEGVKEVDLEGVNSPARGHFKMSFGGQLTTYYSIQL